MLGVVFDGRTQRGAYIEPLAPFVQIWEEEIDASIFPPRFFFSPSFGTIFMSYLLSKLS